MPSRLSRREIEKLSGEIAELDRQRRERNQRYSESELTDAERAFSTLADSKGKSAFRSGWPDFLVVDRSDGVAIAVEVKTHSDRVQPSQRIMFAALEVAGMDVMIWSPEEPQKLTPWRKWDHEHSMLAPIRRTLSKHRFGGPRLPVLGLDRKTPRRSSGG